MFHINRSITSSLALKFKVKVLMDRGEVWRLHFFNQQKIVFMLYCCIYMKTAV